MATKYIKIPPPITFVDLLTKEPSLGPDGKPMEPMTLRRFLLTTALDHPVWSSSVEDARAASDLVEAVDRAEKNASNLLAGVVALNGTVYAKLLDAVKVPKYRTRGLMGGETVANGYRELAGGGALQILPFVDAVIGATDTDPRNQPTIAEDVPELYKARKV